MLWVSQAGHAIGAWPSWMKILGICRGFCDSLSHADTARPSPSCCRESQRKRLVRQLHGHSDGEHMMSGSMEGQHFEQPAAGRECCLKASPIADAPDMQPAGCHQRSGSLQMHPEYLANSLTLPVMQPGLSPQVSLPSPGISSAGRHVHSDGPFRDALASYATQERYPAGHSSPQLQPILALLYAAQQAKRGLLIRAASCEVPEGSGRKLPHKRTPNVLYKTELCRTWSATGQCRYGGKCQFAHGVHELRPVQRHPKYRTEVCRTFAATGNCPYGARCKFIHSRRSSSDSYRSDEEEYIGPQKAYSLPPNFGSPAAANEGAVLTALCNLLASSQGRRLAYSPANPDASASASARSSVMHSNGPLAPAGDAQTVQDNMELYKSYLYAGGQAGSSTQCGMRCEGHGTTGSPFAQDMGSPCLPTDQELARAPQDADVVLSAHLPTAPFHAQCQSTACGNGFSEAADLEACCNGMQGLWNWDSYKDNTSTAATSSDLKTNSPSQKNAAQVPFYPAVSRMAFVPV